MPLDPLDVPFDPLDVPLDPLDVPASSTVLVAPPHAASAAAVVPSANSAARLRRPAGVRSAGSGRAGIAAAQNGHPSSDART